MLRTIPRGLIHCPVTPFREDGRVDYQTFETLVDYHIRQGATSLCPILHVAESLNLTDEERRQLAEISVRVTAGRVPVIVNVSTPGTDQAIELTRHAETIGADAVMSITPYYWKPPEEALYAHFVALGRSTSLPWLAYNSPAHVGVTITPALLTRLVQELENFIGLKDASESFSYFIEAKAATRSLRPEFAVFTGVEYLLPSIVLGGIGSMTVSAGIAPRLLQRLYEACEAERWDEARFLQEKASHLWQLMKVEYPASIKAGMALMGRPVGGTRLPIRTLTDDQQRQVQRDLEAMGILDDEPRGWDASLAPSAVAAALTI